MKLKHILFVAAVFAVIACSAFYAKRSTADNSKPAAEAIAKPTENAPLWINETKFVAETSVASKSKLETGRTPSEITITPIGRLTLAKNSLGVLTYDAQTAHFALDRGCAILYLEKGHIGTIDTGDTKKVLCSTDGCNIIEKCARREIGGFLLWSALGAPAVGLATAGFINSEESGVVASASSLRDIVR